MKDFVTRMYIFASSENEELITGGIRVRLNDVWVTRIKMYQCCIGVYK